MKLIIFCSLIALCFLTNSIYAQVGVLVNPYKDYTNLPSPSYTNASFDVLQTVHNSTTVPGFTGEYEINLDFHQWTPFMNDHVITYDFEVIGFPFTMDCAFLQNSCADCTNLERKLNLPLQSSYDNITHTWNQFLYNDMKFFGKGEFTYGGNSILANGNHQTLVSDFFNQPAFPLTPNRIYFPHTALKLNLYLHCNDNYINPGPVISKISYLYDNTRGRMRDYPFKPDNCGGSVETNYDVIFRPNAVNSTFPTFMYYDDSYQNNSGWTEALGTLNYYSIADINLNGCTSINIPQTSNEYWEPDWVTNTSVYSTWPYPGPYSLQTSNLFGAEGKTLAGYNNDPSSSGILVKNEGITHQYIIDDEFDLSIINTDEKTIYNPSKVILIPRPPATFFNINFPTYYTFKTIRGTVPTLNQVNIDNISDNGGSFYPLTLVPVRTDLRSTEPNELNDINVLRHSIYSSIYSLENGSQITIESCVSLFDMCFDVKDGATLIISDYSQIRGKEDMSVYPSGRFKIRGKGGAILRNYNSIQYVQNGNIFQPNILNYIAWNSIISGANVNVNPDADQLPGDYKIMPGANVTFTAGEYIQLTDGFSVQGGDFHAVINENLLAPPICFANTSQNGGNRFNHNTQMPRDVGSHEIISIIPNPNDGTFKISTNGNEQINLISIYNLLGGCVYQNNNVRNSYHSITLNEGSKGLHFVKVTSETGKIAVVKVMVE